MRDVFTSAVAFLDWKYVFIPQGLVFSIWIPETILSFIDVLFRILGMEMQLMEHYLPNL